MPITPTYPGVYIEEVSSGVRTITPVATAITAFVGWAPMGLANDPVRVQSFADYQRKFGGLHLNSPMSYAVSQYFQNGGTDALIIRVTNQDAVTAKLNVNGLPLQVASAGVYGNQVRAHVNYKTRDPENPKLFNLFVASNKNGSVLEEFRNVSVDKDDPRYVKIILDEESTLVRIEEGQSVPDNKPGASGDFQGEWFEEKNAGAHTQAAGGEDGTNVGEDDLIGEFDKKTGFHALEKTELFNMLCLPPPIFDSEVSQDTYATALKYCVSRRAMLIVDPPASWKSVDAAAMKPGGRKLPLKSMNILQKIKPHLEFKSGGRKTLFLTSE